MQLTQPKPRRGSLSKHFKWHSNWSIDTAKREARHASGLVYEFTPGLKGHLTPPLGDGCPCGCWSGKLRGGTSSLPADQPPDRNKRLCLEACLLFSEEAWDVCQDCSMHTAETDFYMVDDDLWLAAHPQGVGMLCLSCLDKRSSRGLHFLDFVFAGIHSKNGDVEAINSKNKKVQAMIEAAQPLPGELYEQEVVEQVLAGKGLTDRQTHYMTNALWECVRKGLHVITNNDCAAALHTTLREPCDEEVRPDIQAALASLEGVKFSCTWRVPDDVPVFLLSPEHETVQPAET